MYEDAAGQPVVVDYSTCPPLDRPHQVCARLCVCVCVYVRVFDRSRGYPTLTVTTRSGVTVRGFGFGGTNPIELDSALATCKPVSLCKGWGWG